MSARAPIEIWTEILLGAFEIPMAIGPNHSIICRWDTEFDYWKSERQRCVLRLVCHSWKAAVDRRSYRLVQMWDFVENSLSDDILMSAERIMFNLPSRSGSWSARKNPAHNSNLVPQNWKWLDGTKPMAYGWWWLKHQILLLQRFLTVVSTHPSPAKVQALHLVLYDPSIVKENFSALCSLKNLISLELEGVSSCAELDLISMAFPQLIHLSLHILDSYRPEFGSFKTVSFPSLRFFRYTGTPHHLRKMNFAAWHLPALETLALSELYRTETTVSLLSPFGKTLRCILFGDNTSPRCLLDERIWNCFPNIQIIGWDVPGNQITESPPVDYTFSTLLIDPLQNPDDIQTWLEKCPSIKRVKVLSSWTGLNLLNEDQEGLIKALERVGNGVEVVDLNEVLLGKWMESKSEPISPV